MEFRALSATVILLGLAAMVMNVVLVAVLALPFAWLWNWTLVPLLQAPMLGYRHALGLLLLWTLLQWVGAGVKLGLKLRSPAQD